MRRKACVRSVLQVYRGVRFAMRVILCVLYVSGAYAISCNAGAFANAANNGCLACRKDFYCPKDSTSETPCPSYSSTLNLIARGNVSDCVCNPGYGRTNIYLNCTACLPSLVTRNGVCVPCGANTFYNGSECQPCRTCSPNATVVTVCAGGGLTDTAKCLCKDGFEGDGFECAVVQSSSSESMPAWLLYIIITVSILGFGGLCVLLYVLYLCYTSPQPKRPEDKKNSYKNKFQYEPVPAFGVKIESF